MINFLHPWVFLCALCAGIALVCKRKFFNSDVQYVYPAARLLGSLGTSDFLFRLLATCRWLLFGALICALARPYMPDSRSRVDVQGIDIMLVFDVSGSMQLFDDVQDKRTRISVARHEAIKFIEKRTQDPIGIVIFGASAVSRCPLTMDKKLLTSLIDQTAIGDLDPDGTTFALGLSMAVNRLRTSQATSKIIIALTDGAPLAHDIDPKIPIDLAKKCGIKIYTIGIGGDHGGYLDHPMYGTVAVATPLNKKLLYECAAQTGGEFFEAKKPEDINHIYARIDELEKTQLDVPVYARMHEFFMRCYGLLR